MTVEGLYPTLAKDLGRRYLQGVADMYSRMDVYTERTGWEDRIRALNIGCIVLLRISLADVYQSLLKLDAMACFL
jgi:hypothetical protein